MYNKILERYFVYSQPDHTWYKLPACFTASVISNICRSCCLGPFNGESIHRHPYSTKAETPLLRTCQEGDEKEQVHSSKKLTVFLVVVERESKVCLKVSKTGSNVIAPHA